MTFKKYKLVLAEDDRFKKLNFDTDDRNHYVYRVSCLLEKNNYYGSKTEDEEDTIGLKYFTSSKDKKFKKDFKANPKNYKVKVIKRFDNPGDKILYESYLHQYFNVKDHDNFINQVNQTAFGFDNTGVTPSEETKERQRKAHANPEKKAMWLIANSKPVFQYDLDGNFIKEFISRKGAAQEVGIANSSGIGNCCFGIQKIAGGYQWKDTYFKKIGSCSTGHDEPVEQYDLDGNFIKEFESQKEAFIKTKITGISACVTGRQNTSGGFMWKRK